MNTRHTRNAAEASNTVDPERIFHGTVKFYNTIKGFGFIKCKEDQQEYFVHATGLVEEIKENDPVTFSLVQGRKGLNAVNVAVG